MYDVYSFIAYGSSKNWIEHYKSRSMISHFARNVFNCCSYFNTSTCNLWHLTPAYILKLYNDNVDVHTLRKARMLLENKIAKSPASLTTIGYRAICYVLLTTKAFDSEQVDLHQRQSIMIWILLLIYCNCKLVFHCVLCNCWCMFIYFYILYFFYFYFLFCIIFCIFLCSLLLFLLCVCVVLSVRFYNK